MHAFSCFNINITATASDVEKFKAYFSGKCQTPFYIEGKVLAQQDPQTGLPLREDRFCIDDCYDVVWYDDLVDLAENLVKEIPSASFSMDGVIDCSESSGEYMDFTIEYADGKFSSSCSDWYSRADEYYFAGDEEDYEE